MSRETERKESNVHTYTPGVLDTELGYPMACRLRILYEKKMGEDWKNLETVDVKRFARFIGKVFKINVPAIGLMKRKKMEKRYEEKGVYGACEVKNGRCKKIWLEKEMVKEGDGAIVYLVLLHELRHCWQVTNYMKYYGEQEDTLELQVLREADAQAFAELVMYYLFEYSYSYGDNSVVERKRIDDEKNEIRTDFWNKIKEYYRFHGGLKGRREIREIDENTYGRKN